MKHFSAFLLSTFLCVSLFAVPAMRVRVPVRMFDGSTLLVSLYGDEHYSWFLSDDGYVVEPVAEGAEVYVKTARTFDEEVERATRHREEAARRVPRRIGSQATAPLPAHGTVRVPVVLVNFTDSVFHVADTDEEIRKYYDLFCNGTRDGKLYRGHGSYGSVRDYFVQQSDGQFQPEFTIIGPVTLNKPEGYYGGDRSEKSKDSCYTAFFREAIAAATEMYEGNWMDFDNKGKGQVDMVFYVYAGCGQNSGAPSSTLWPKESTSGTTLNGICFATTGCTSENTAKLKVDGQGRYVLDKDGNYIVVGSKPDGIGVFCHELSHALGLPDFYDTSYKAFGMDLWSLMDYGCYGGGGFCPGAYNGYERDFMGWRRLGELNEPCDLTLTAMELGGTAYKIVNDENPDEYYIIENRQREGWDYSVCSYSKGLQVTHVDYDASAWNSNNVNTKADHQRMTIIAANNRYVGTSISNDGNELVKTWTGNLYPFIDRTQDPIMWNDSLTALSTPAATVYSESGFMYKNINAIKQLANGDVSLHFGNDYVVVNIDGIEDYPHSKVKENVTFDLSGRRLQDAVLPKGVYIVGGRKRIVR